MNSSVSRKFQSWRGTIREELRALAASDLRRELRTVSGAQGPVMRLEGRALISLSGNNYLGLADHPALAGAATGAAEKWGSGAAASPLVAGHMEPHAAFEAGLAEFKNYEAAILFGSGYLANLGLISSLVGREDAVFSDALNHASIVDGCRLSHARLHVFPHNDIDALERGLRKEGGVRRKLIVVDGVFSMDGDFAPLKDLADIAGRHGAILLVDEAHATGVFGPGGRGAAAHFGVTDEVGVSMGTLGKGLGCYGAFACADHDTIAYLVNRTRPFIYSTALPPPTVAAAHAALDLVRGEEGEKRRARLRTLCARFRKGLLRIGFGMPSGGGEGPIFPLIVGTAKDALALSGYMLDAGVMLAAIRPPTVPEGTSRLRASLMATHTEAHISYVLGALEEGVKKLGLHLR